MIEKEYNLLDEPWIEVRMDDGQIRSMGLKEIFQKAGSIRSISGDMPAQDAVILRLLLAILYAVYLRTETGRSMSDEDDAYDYWHSIWKNGRFDEESVCSYLESNRERFYLFHEKFPFYQSRITKGTEYTVAKLNGTMSESSNKPRMFAAVSGKKKFNMDYSNAARWLLYTNAYDDNSGKPTVRGSNLPTPGVGWVGKLGLVFSEGKNLFETLMLNLPFSDDEGEPFKDGVAIWERPVPEDRERINVPLPESPIELLTLQCRRILLKREGDSVSGYLLLGGDVVHPESAFIEQMTMWKFKKDGTWVPKLHDPSRAMWRDFSSLMLRSETDSEEHRRPGILRWMAGLVDRSMVDARMVRIRATGVKYGDKDFFVDDLIDDSISFDHRLLSEINESWNERVNDVVHKTDQCVRLLVTFSSKIFEFSRVEESIRKKKVSSVRAEAFSNLNSPFRSWLSSIDPSETDIEEVTAEWMNTVERTLRSLGRVYLDESGLKSMRGNTDSKDPLENNAFTAFNRFTGDLYKITRCKE